MNPPRAQRRYSPSPFDSDELGWRFRSSSDVYRSPRAVQPSPLKRLTHPTTQHRYGGRFEWRVSCAFPCRAQFALASARPSRGPARRVPRVARHHWQTTPEPTQACLGLLSPRASNVEAPAEQKRLGCWGRFAGEARLRVRRETDTHTTQGGSETSALVFLPRKVRPVLPCECRLDGCR